MKSTEERILSLEKRMRTHRLFLGFLIVLLIAAISVGAQQAKKEPSRPYSIYDSNGQLRVLLNLNRDALETPGLWFLDSEGKKRLYLGLNKNDDPGIFFYNRAGDFTWIKVSEDSKSGEGDPNAPSTEPEIIWPRENTLVRVNNWQNSKYFHKADCKELYGAPRKAYVREARKRGLKPCPKCFPECYEE